MERVTLSEVSLESVICAPYSKCLRAAAALLHKTQVCVIEALQETPHRL